MCICKYQKRFTGVTWVDVTGAIRGILALERNSGVIESRLPMLEAATFKRTFITFPNLSNLQIQLSASLV